MDLLPNELIDLICFNLKCITDIRNLSRIGKKYNLKCQKHITNMETLYKKKHKRLDLVKHFDKHSVEKFTIEIVLDNYYDLLPEKYYNKNNGMMCAILALCGNFELLKIAHLTSCPLEHYAASCAAHEGHVKILDWISKHININMRLICSNGAGNGHVNVLDWLLENKYEIRTKELDTCVVKASHRGHTNVLNWLLQHNYIIDVLKCIESASNDNRIKILQWLFDHNLVKNNSFCDHAKTNGYVDVLDFALNNGFIITNNYLDLIIAGGKIDVLQWLYDNNGFKPNNNYCINTVVYGHIDIFKWMLEHGCSVNEKVINSVIKYNKINILQWLLDNKYKMDNNNYKVAIHHRQHEILSWIIKNNLHIEQIALQITPSLSNTMIKLLLKHNYLIIDPTNFIELLSNNIDIGIIQLIGEKHFITKKQYHFIIENNNIKIKNYETGPDLNKQKIICYENDGNIDICDFNCDCKCWWYFLIFCENKNQDVKIFAKNKINGCNKHTKYINML